MTSPPANGRNTSPGISPPASAGGQLPAQHVVKRTRVGGVWVASALFAVVLLLLLIFILENGQRVDIGYFGAHGHLPLGVALLLAAVLGVLLVVIPGTGRIIQLRLLARRHRRLDAQRGAAAPQPPAAQSAPAAQQAQPSQSGPNAPGDPALPGQPLPSQPLPDSQRAAGGQPVAGQPVPQGQPAPPGQQGPPAGYQP
jgi:uncharacterized integral membrane protein